MHVNELKNSLALMTKLIEAEATKVSEQPDTVDSGFEFIGFRAFANVLAKDQPTDEEEILKLFDTMHEVLAKKLRRGPMHLVWKNKPDLIFSATGIRIGCRVKLVPTVALVKAGLVGSECDG